jgi:hypothetical protein
MKNLDAFYTAFVLATAALFGLFFSSGAHAADPKISRSELISRLRLKADVLVLEDDGKHLVQMGDESRFLSGFSTDGKFKRDWSSDSTGYGVFKLRHEWTVDANGSIHVKFEEFLEEELDSKTGQAKDFKNPIGTEEHDVVDFGSVLYSVKAIKGKRVVLRFTPELAGDTRAETIGKFKVIGRGVSIYDSEGALWASDLDFAGEYLAIVTHRGTLVLSYSPFKGSEPAGVASGKKLTLRMKEYPRVTLQGDTDFVPEGMNARVFVKYLKEKRTNGLNSVRIADSSNEQRMLEQIK